jgi:lipoprotein-releasing system ATP-binding protein
MNKIILNATQIFKHFGEGLERVNVLNGLTLEIREGESLAIVGSSGSGKSTLLHLLGGLDTPSSGEVTMLGRNWMKMNDAERSTTRNTHLGFVYQMNHLLSDFTALENVAMPLRIRGDEKSEALNKAKTELESVGLGHRLTSHRPCLGANVSVWPSLGPW